MKNSVQFKRRLNHFLTYLYMVVLSIVIIYPLLITVLSAFKSGNVSAFTLDFSGNLVVLITSQNFSLKPIMALVYEHLGYRHYHHDCTNKYRYLCRLRIQPLHFLARKQSLVFFLIIQMVPLAALTAFFVMALMLNALNQTWFLIFLYVGGGIQ